MMYRKNHIKIYQTTFSFYSKKDLKSIKIKQSGEKNEKLRYFGNFCNSAVSQQTTKGVDNVPIFSIVLLIQWIRVHG